MEIVILAYSSSLTVYTSPNTCCYNSSYLTLPSFKTSLVQLRHTIALSVFSHGGNLVAV
jgi:hypothetical protein